MSEPFPPPIGARIASRFDVLAPLRGEGPVRVFFAQDRQTGKRCVLSLFDPSRTTAVVWDEYVRIIAAASAAHIPGLALPSNVPSELPTPPHVVEAAPSYLTLDRLLAQERRLPWERALNIVERVAGVLHAAHAATQAAHGALTPYRIAVEARDEVQVLDLGVAEFDLPGDSGEEPDYRAPEQRERGADAAVDVYTLALLLQGLISGTVPAGTPPPRLGSLASVPPALEPLLQSALSPNPALRPDLSSLRARMRELLGLPALPMGPPAAPAGPPPSPPRDLAPIRPAALTTPAQERNAAPVTRLAPPVGQRSAVEPTAERTEVLATYQPPQETTLILPTHGDPPTEKVIRTSIPHPRPSATSPSAPAPAGDPTEDRTSIFTRAPRRTSLVPDRTEVMPRRASSPAAALDRTEVLSPLGTRTPAAAPERTVPLTLLLPTRANLPQPAPMRPAPRVDTDDELTIATTPVLPPQRGTVTAAPETFRDPLATETPHPAGLLPPWPLMAVILGLGAVAILAALISVLS